MVDLREERVQETKAIGTIRSTKRGHIYGKAITCYFNLELFNQIHAEARRRHWTFSHMVRHLCEASINGIE